MSKEISYNLPGFGFANCLLFGNAVSLMELLEKRGIIEKMKNVCQLGTMKYVYPGAHHTRYEYAFTQIMLISNIVATRGSGSRNIELSLTSSLKEYESKSYRISGGEVLQCLALLSNAGHMYDTFTSSKLITRLLQESKNNGTAFYSTYRRNLPADLRTTFDKLLETSNYYKLHLYNMIHLLKGMAHTPADESLCNLCVLLLSQLINPDLVTNEATQRIFHLYKKIRKIAYLSIDMVYTPASFGANLSRMIYSISSSIDELFDESSPMNQSINQLEDIIHRQIYDSPQCILNTTRIEQDRYVVYRDAIDNIKTIFDIRNLVLEKIEPYKSLHSISTPTALKDLLPKSVLLLSGLDPISTRKNLLTFDERVLTSIPSSRIAFGTQAAQNFETTYAAFGLISSKRICEDVQKIVAQAISYKLFRTTECAELMKYAIFSVYKYGDFFFNLSAPTGLSLNECVIIGNGCRNTAKMIRSRFSSQNISSTDQLHEVLSCADVLDQLTYQGLTVCFVGGVKASQYNKTQKLDELDGFIYFPTRDNGKTFAVIVEAKNKNYGGREAAKQLRATIPFLSNRVSATITELAKSAYMELQIKTAP